MTELAIAWSALALSVVSLALSAYALRRVRVTAGLWDMDRCPEPPDDWPEEPDPFPGYTGVQAGEDDYPGRD